MNCTTVAPLPAAAIPCAIALELPGPTITTSAIAPSVASRTCSTRLSPETTRPASAPSATARRARVSNRSAPMMRAGPEMTREHDVHHAHDAESDNQDTFAALESRAAKRLDHAGGRLDQHAVGVGERVGQTQRVALVVRTHHEVLGHPARHDFGRAPGRALYVLTAPARRALEAGRMMVDEDALAAAKAAHRCADLLDHADRLMAEHQRRLAPDVPGHDVARADAAGAGAHQNFVGRRARDGGPARRGYRRSRRAVQLASQWRTLWSARSDVKRSALIIDQSFAITECGRSNFLLPTSEAIEGFSVPTR